jgi:hypothetical protein
VVILPSPPPLAPKKLALAAALLSPTTTSLSLSLTTKFSGNHERRVDRKAWVKGAQKGREKTARRWPRGADREALAAVMALRRGRAVGGRPMDGADARRA